MDSSVLAGVNMTLSALLLLPQGDDTFAGDAAVVAAAGCEGVGVSAVRDALPAAMGVGGAGRWDAPVVGWLGQGARFLWSCFLLTSVFLLLSVFTQLLQSLAQQRQLILASVNCLA